MKLSIIIVSWNVKRYLVDCLNSLQQYPPSHKYEIIVVDNNSIDGTSDLVKEKFPYINFIKNKQNLGFAAANNRGIKVAKGLYIFLLNPDTIVHKGAVDRLIGFMDDNPDVGACGPKLLNADGTTQGSVRQFPTFRAALYRHTIFSLVGLFRGQYRKWLMKDFAYDTQRDVDQLMGSALMIRMSVIEQVGRMDESFFMYYEEVDLCYRIKQAGWRVVFMPEAAITHLAGRSAAQTPVAKRIMMLTSLLTFFRKRYGRFRTGLFAVIFKPLVLLIYFYYLCRDLIKYIFAFLLFNRDRQIRCAGRVRNWILFLGKYSWRLLFKM